MNALKTMVMLLFLAGVGYVVYLSITKSPRRPHEPTTAAVWPTMPKSQLPAPGGLMPRMSGDTGDGQAPLPGGSFGTDVVPAPTHPIPPAHPSNGAPNATAGMSGLSPSLGLSSTTAPNSPENTPVRTLPPRPSATPAAPVYGSPVGGSPERPPVAAAIEGGYSPPMPSAAVPSALPASPPAPSTVNDFAYPRAPTASTEWGAAGEHSMQGAAASDPWNRAPAEGTHPAATHPAAADDDRPMPARPSADAASPAAPSARDPLQWAGDLGGQTPVPPANPVRAAADARGDAELVAQFRAIMETIRQRLDEGKLDEGLQTLTQLYEMPSLPEQQRIEVADLMGQVAGTVIYSKQSIVHAPHRVEPGESLEMIAARYQLTPELLMKINGLPDRSAVRPGDMLKVLPGPFSAVVSMERRELVLYLGGMYAGRFPIGIGRDQPRLEGVYGVRDKVRMPAYFGPDQVNIPPGDPRNPLGRAALDLGNGVALHGCDSPSAVGRDDNRGTICLGDRDLADLFDILTIGSKVTIQR